ncbi:OprO/OprP family phosphate-selective porin [Acetobacter oeni]|uniref:Porin n=1 Tax=Acetobacter oeni TaxID=304077 RepID=A0A511XJ64_9PROT|nr:porin [Acetobacter oeni]MBB3882820.1 phosphate-selective porin [Acetobacter oeni]NHO18909.1 hypothetical protein [Acetobacter oeni]GBR09636.1 hypothetical protein AA21952_2898 [Acetobacter oeni LMG 21952]GEN62993.1 hypothetical protein AOE01nite_12170 [Acetobacter oeni]
MNRHSPDAMRSVRPLTPQSGKITFRHAFFAGTTVLLWSGEALAASRVPSSAPASAGGVDVRALAELVKAQAQQIHDLQARLANVEKQTKPATTHIRTATQTARGTRPSQPPSGPQPARPPASVTVLRAARPGEDITPQFGTTPAADNSLFSTQHMIYPLTAAAPGTAGAVSAIPSGSAPVMGVASKIPASARTTTVGGLVLNWGKGLPEITTPDGDYSFRVRGRILADYGAAFGSRFPVQNVSRTTLRAVRLGVEGRAKQLSWVFEGDYSNNQLTVVSAYATWSDKMAGHLAEYTIGNKFNERSFDGSTGSDATVFLDRDLVANALLPVKGWYGLGGAFKIFGKSWHVAAQISGDDINSTNVTGNLRDDLTYELRTHWIPWRSKTGLIHLGAWGFYEDVKPAATFAQSIRLLARTDDAFAARINSNPIANSLAGGLELFGIWKSAWALAEYGARHMEFRNTYGSQTYNFRAGTIQAASLQAGMFLTGETPNYFAHTGQWSTPRVLNPVSDGGIGAWEVAVRGDWLDARDIPGGTGAWSATAGVNWYIVNYMRLMLNYTHAHVNNKAGAYPGATGGNIIGARAGITF